MEPNRPLRMRDSSASPPEIATPSAFSRSRTSAKRKSASRRWRMKFSEISGRPIKWASKDAATE